MRFSLLGSLSLKVLQRPWHDMTIEDKGLQILSFQIFFFYFKELVARCVGIIY